jgi:hypothetical protein
LKSRHCLHYARYSEIAVTAAEVNGFKICLAGITARADNCNCPV